MNNFVTSPKITSLIFVIAIMAFLLNLTFAALLWGGSLIYKWQTNINSEITIQIKPNKQNNITKDIQTAHNILKTFNGIKKITILTKEKNAELLKPWLDNQQFEIKNLSLPRLIAVAIDPDNPPDSTKILAALQNKLDNVSLNQHDVWSSYISTTWWRVSILGSFIFCIVLFANMLVVIFATRGSMANNSDMIEVLHFIGATPTFIARQFQFHFFIMGLQGAVLGTAIAIGFLLLFFSDIFTTSTFNIATLFYIGVLCIVLFLALLTSITSRFVVVKAIE